MKTLAERMIWARQQKGKRENIDFTQKMLAEKAKVSQGSIGHLESGRTETTRKLLAIAKVLEVNPGWLADGNGVPFAEVASRAAPQMDSLDQALILLSLYKRATDEWREAIVDFARGADDRHALSDKVK